MEINVVTGGTGFLGKYLVRRLLGSGKNVWVIVRPIKGFSVKELREHAKTLNIHGHENMQKHELVHHLHGRGLFDWIPIIKDKIKKYYEKIPEPIKDIGKMVIKYSRNVDSFNKKSKATLEKYGNQKIVSIKIFKQIIKGALGTALSVITATDGSLYHLGLLLTLQDGTEITLEKNHNVKLEAVSTIKQGDQLKDVDLKGKSITLNELVDKTIQTVGKKQFFEYDGFGGQNCQNAVSDILRSNGLLTKDATDFTMQDLSEHKKIHFWDQKRVI
jgi:hypothetical protein